MKRPLVAAAVLFAASPALADDGTAGHTGSKAFFKSADGAHYMQIKGQLQSRYLFNKRNNTGGDDTEYGFQIRRGKVQIKGNAFSKRIKFYMQLAAGRKINVLALEDAYVDMKLSKTLTFRAGRFKHPFLAEEMVSSKRQMAVERTSFNEFFTLNRTEGVQLQYQQGMVRARILAGDGAESGNIGGDPVTGSNDFDKDRVDFALTSRVELKLVGDSFKISKDFTAWPGKATAVFVGGGLHYEKAESDLDDAVDYRAWTADALLKTSGLSLFGAAAGSTRDPGGKNELNHFGYMAQAAYHLASNLEPFARFESTDIDGAGTARVVTFGLNQYWEGHYLKLTADVVYGLDPLTEQLDDEPFGADGVSGGLGLRPDVDGESGQIAGRLQLQLVW